MGIYKKKRVTVFIGRFSPFHNGHAEVLKLALQTSNLVLVLVGSSGQARTTKNPFTFSERESMIRAFEIQTRPGTGSDYNPHDEIGNYGELVIEPIYDHPYNDNAWIKGVQDIVNLTKAKRAQLYPETPVYLTGSDRDRSTWYLNSFGDFFKMDLVTNHSAGLDLSATKIRNVLFGLGMLSEIRTMVPPSTFEFLRDFKGGNESFPDLLKEYDYETKYKKNWSNEELLRLIKIARDSGLNVSQMDDIERAAKAICPFPVSIQTVDTCVIQSGHVLVCIRDNFPGKGLWCLPGGHLDVDTGERLLDAAIRELTEETRIELSRAQLYGSVRDKEEFDYAYRSLKGRVITMCYLLKLDDSKPLPKVKPQKGEVKKVMWIPISEALSLNNLDKWFDDHYHILETMYGRIKN
jgi:bifunctional NMN adenylyltransferase/nudix hydrolase